MYTLHFNDDSRKFKTDLMPKCTRYCIVFRQLGFALVMSPSSNPNDYNIGIQRAGYSK